jgi:DNA-binding winged helix-turn-helix (wHTH) protein
MISGLRWSRPVIAAAGVVFLAAAIACIAWLSVHGVLRARAEEFRGRCLLYATTIANTLPTWLGESEIPDLGALARYAAVTGLAYVQITSGGTVLLEVAESPEAESVLADAEDFVAPRVVLGCVSGKHLANAAVPYGLPPRREGDPARGPYASGILRVGVDASALAWAADNTQALAIELAALAWVGASVGLGLLLRRPGRAVRESVTEPGLDRAGARVARAGNIALHVDEARLDVAGRSIRLAPKQLALLKVLMSDPGRAFGDKEILAEAWPDSPYADSKDVKQCVYLIRRRLDGAGLPGDRIVANVPGVGYRIDSSAVGGLVDEGRDISVVQR